jgi:alpha-tubulin suppressor-like RCC1 family protein
LWVGRLDTCGVSTGGRGFCWGANQHGEIGVAFVSLEEDTSSPIEVDGDLRLKQITPAWIHTCAITTASATRCWGTNQNAQLGIGSQEDVPHRVAVSPIGGIAFVQLSVSASHSCALTADGTAYCWGENRFGQLGDGTTRTGFVPTPVLTSLKFTSIATSSGFATGGNVALPTTTVGVTAHTCALTSAGTPYCWGWNGNGQLGDGTTTTRLSPVPVSGNLTLTQIALGGAYTCGMQGNAVWCWGANALGQLGRGQPTTASAVPMQVGPPFDKP